MDNSNIPIDLSLKRKRTPPFDADRGQPAHTATHQYVDPPAAAAVANGQASAGDDQLPANSSSQPRYPAGHLQINYLARHFKHDLPLASCDDTCPNIISLLNDYHGVFDRHESMASNLGAPSLGGDWVQRFESMFESPPRLVSHPPGYIPSVSWLDIVEFASTWPEQFTLTPEGQLPRVCQLYLKECDIVISEQDYNTIKTRRLQHMIPTLPPAADEEKELGALQILERTINEVVHFADQVALRGRVFVRRLGERKAAIVERRAADLANGGDSNTDPALTNLDPAAVSQAVHDELVRAFNAVDPQRPQIAAPAVVQPRPTPSNKSTRRPHTTIPFTGFVNTGQGEFSTHTRPRPSDADSQFKADMMARTEACRRGERIYPPCDRCRRLRIDCIKNLTACVGCTKKHARCSWRDVKPEELAATPPPPLDSAAHPSTAQNPSAARPRIRFVMAPHRPDLQAHRFRDAHYAPAEQQQQQRHHDDYQPYAPSGVHHHHHHHQQPQGPYMPAYDPVFEDPHGPAAATAAAARAELAPLEDAEHERIQQATRSLAVAAMHSHNADLALGQQQQQQRQGGGGGGDGSGSGSPQDPGQALGASRGAQAGAGSEQRDEDSLRIERALQRLGEDGG